MNTFEEYAAAASRTPCGLLVITLDACANVFGTAPCTASGEPCHNTWNTCRDRANYSRTTRDYEFTSVDATPLPLVGPRPYLKSAKLTAAEIKAGGKGGSKGTLTARATFDLLDEPDSDVGLDPYLDQRAAPLTASFWKRLLARNPNYIQRPVRYFEGFVGLARSEWQQRWLGDIEEITLGNGTVSLKTVDQLKRLDGISLPPKVDIKLVTAIDAAAVEIILTTLDGLDDPAGHIRIDDEVISYSGVDTAQNKLTGCSRAAARTTAASHSAGAKVTKVLRLSGNPFDLLQELLTTYAGIAAGDIASADFAAAAAFPAEEPTFTTWLTESIKLDKLFWELVELLDAQVWFSEEQLITCARTLPNAPGRGYTAISDSANIANGSLKVDLNAASRQTQIIVNWDKSAIGKDDEETRYGRVTVAIDGPSGGENGNGLIPRTLNHRWLSLAELQEEIAEEYASALAYRRLWRWADPMALIDLEVELKDGAIRTGSYLRLSSAAVLNPAGSPLDRAIAQVVKRAQGKGHNLALRVWMIPDKRLAIIAPDATPDYDDASEPEREYGFISGDDERMPSDLSNAYYIW
jgi:hypothetical protein